MALDFERDNTINVSISLRESTAKKVDKLVETLRAQSPQKSHHRINRSSVIDQIVAEKLENMPCE